MNIQMPLQTGSGIFVSPTGKRNIFFRFQDFVITKFVNFITKCFFHVFSGVLKYTGSVNMALIVWIISGLFSMVSDDGVMT
jgi:hypothetical protein